MAQSLVDAFRGQPIRLVIDTTKLGFNSRLMTVSIAYRKRALPLVWSVHRGKKGWVGVKEQIALFRWVAELIPEGSEVWVIGDCEFQHVPLISWVKGRGWHYVFRQQSKILVWQPGEAQKPLADFGLKEGETRYLDCVYLTQEHHYGPVSMVLHWEAGEEEPWYLATARRPRGARSRSTNSGCGPKKCMVTGKDMALISNRHTWKISTDCRGWCRAYA